MIKLKHYILTMEQGFKTMKKYYIFVILFIIAFSFNAADVLAADFVVVDIKKVVDESVAAKGVREQIKVKRDTFQKKITEQEEKLRETDKKLSEQRSLLSPEAFEEKRNEFNCFIR